MCDKIATELVHFVQDLRRQKDAPLTFRAVFAVHHRSLANQTSQLSALGMQWTSLASCAYSTVNDARHAQVTCGSVIKLQHANTGVNLHSHEISYGSGSGQQSVTGYTGGDDANDYWAVRGVEVSQSWCS